MTTTSPHLYAVILAGGSGTRFWPASRRLRPKQLLPLGPAAPHSLLRATVDRLSGLIAPTHIHIATGAHLVDATRHELPELSEDVFLSEPCAKNTAPCIGWAAALLAARDPHAIVVVLPSDQHAADRDEFQRVLAKAVAVAEQGYITTIGVIPTRAETGYGYIELGSAALSGGNEVRRFVEKPDQAHAQQYFESGQYLWNAGMFVFRAADMWLAFQQHLPTMARELDKVVHAYGNDRLAYESAVEGFFATTEAVSIDYGIMEKAGQLRVIPGDFGWSDLGSWESAWELSTKNDEGNAAPMGTVFVDSRNNLVQDSTSHGTKKVIAMLGVDDLCVVETDDALLILPRRRSQEVRSIVERLKSRGDTGKL